MATRMQIADVKKHLANVEYNRLLECRSDELEAILDRLVDLLPPDDGIAGQWRLLLGELADTNLHLKRYYKQLADLQ